MVRQLEAVINILAEYFGVTKSEVVLLKGLTSRAKIFEVYWKGDKNG